MASSSQNHAQHRRLVTRATISSLAVMGSRILGLLREQVFAYFFGACREYDAFLTAFRIPNLLRDLLAEGALSAAFVPTFVKELQLSGKARAFEVANLVVSTLCVLLLVLIVAGMLGSAYLVKGLAVGFDAEKAVLATYLTRLMFPYIFLAAMAAVCMGMLNAFHYFGLPQSASSFFNLTSIGMGLLLAYSFAPQYMLDLWQQNAHSGSASQAPMAMVGMSLGTLCGGVAQLVVQLPALYKLGYRFVPRWNLADPGLRQVLRLMGPAVLGAAAVQLNVFINSNFASLLGDKSISWLNYAFRLMQFPIGVFGVAVMSASLPEMSRHVAAANRQGFGQTLMQGLELVLALTVPAAVGLAVLSQPIIALIYQHGRFDSSDTMATAHALLAYAVGLPSYAAIKLLQPAFVAIGQAKTPMYTSFLTVLANMIINSVFVYYLKLGHMGLALSTSLVTTGNVLLLYYVFERRQQLLDSQRLLQELGKVAMASAVMGFVAHALLLYLHAVIPHVGHILHATACVGLIILSMLVYAALAIVFKIHALAPFWRRLSAG